MRLLRTQTRYLIAFVPVVTSYPAAAVRFPRGKNMEGKFCGALMNV